MTCLREVLFRAVPRLSSRVWRRAVTTSGLVYFVPIHIRPTVAKKLCPELYGRFREARHTSDGPWSIGTGKGLKGLSGGVHIFHRRGPPSPSLGISVLSKRLSNELVVRSQYGLELVVWLGPATNWIVAPTVARAHRPLSNERGARKRTKEHRTSDWQMGGS